AGNEGRAKAPEESEAELALRCVQADDRDGEAGLADVEADEHYMTQSPSSQDACLDQCQGNFFLPIFRRNRVLLPSQRADQRQQSARKGLRILAQNPLQTLPMDC